MTGRSIVDDRSPRLSLSKSAIDWQDFFENVRRQVLRFVDHQDCATPVGMRIEQVLVEGIDQFKNDLVVERNAQDVNRLDFLLGPDLINQLRVIGAQIQFLL